MNPPPFLVSFADERAFKRALKPEIIDTYWSDCERLIHRSLPPAVSARVVACLFGFSARFVGAMIHRPERYYRTFSIPKGRGHREIHAPKVALKVIQKWIGHYLASAVRFDDCVYGFLPGKSAPMAAATHCGAEWVYSLDIENFFPTTSAQRVTLALEELGYPHHAATLISGLSCYGGNLAQGSPASPVLSNLAFKACDQLLMTEAQAAAVVYTRYADDIVFSGKGEVPSGFQARVRDVIREDGWRLAHRKEYLA